MPYFGKKKYRALSHVSQDGKICGKKYFVYYWTIIVSLLFVSLRIFIYITVYNILSFVDT